MGCAAHPNASNTTNLTWTGKGADRKEVVVITCNHPGCGATVSRKEG